MDFFPRLDQWLFLVPLKGGRWHIIPQLAVYTTYIPLIYCLVGGLYATYHLSGEPETTIDWTSRQMVNWYFGSTVVWIPGISL